jgi:hypothetical protein
LAEVLIERDDDLEDADMKDWETKNGGGGNYDEQGSAGGSAGISAAHPTPSFIPPPLSPYNSNIMLAEVLMERNEDLEEAEMEDRETEDGGGVKHV